MSRLLSLARVLSEGLFGFLLPPTQWTARDHLLIAELFTFGFVIAALDCILYALPHRHDYLLALKCGVGAIASGLIALHSWNQWLVKRRAA